MSFRILLILALSALGAAAASAPIGVLTTVGAVRMNDSEVRGNGTVMDGAVIETTTNPSQLSLKNGARFELSPNSRAKVYDNRVLLDRGASQLHISGAYAVQVDSVRVTPSGANATVRVFRTGPNSFEVAAVHGEAEIRNKQGLLVARVFPGSPLDLAQQPEGAAGPSRVFGKVTKSAGHYLLKDSTTNTTVELQGNQLDTVVGRCAAVTGSADPSATAVAGATQLIHVSELKPLACGKKGAIAAAAAAGGAAGGAAAAAATGGAAGGAAAGLSAVAIGGIVAGTATAATIGGLAAAGKFSSPRATGASAP